MRLAALVLALIMAVVLALQNTAIVQVSVLTWTVNTSLAVVLMFCLVAGFIMGLLALAPSFFAGRRNARRLQRMLAQIKTADSSASLERYSPANEGFRANEPGAI